MKKKNKKNKKKTKKQKQNKTKQNRNMTKGMAYQVLSCHDQNVINSKVYSCTLIPLVCFPSFKLNTFVLGHMYVKMLNGLKITAGHQIIIVWANWGFQYQSNLYLSSHVDQSHPIPYLNNIPMLI